MKLIFTLLILAALAVGASAQLSSALCPKGESLVRMEETSPGFLIPVCRSQAPQRKSPIKRAITQHQVTCTVGDLSPDGTRSVVCILPNAECRRDRRGEICKATLFNIPDWPAAWEHKSAKGSKVRAVWKENLLTPVDDRTCEERIAKRARELIHMSARLDVDALTPADCHHLSEDKRLRAAKQ